VSPPHPDEPDDRQVLEAPGQRLTGTEGDEMTLRRLPGGEEALSLDDPSSTPRTDWRPDVLDSYRGDANVDYAMSQVREELERAMAKFGPFASPHEGWAVIQEEVDELWDEVKANRGRTHHAIEEARQAAAMAIRYLVDFPFPAPVSDDTEGAGT
jgi:hypothetical protein